MKWHLILIKIVILGFVTHGDIIGQELLRGNITDKITGEKLIGAQVIWVSDYSIGSVSDVDGYFEISTEGKIDSSKLLVTYIGYEEKTFIYEKGKQEVIQIELTTKAIETQMIVITAEKILSEEFATAKLNKLDIYTNPNSRADPLRAVNSLPFTTNSDETANISLRGSPPGETGIFFNGVPIQDAFRLDQANGVGQFSIFNTAIVGKVNIHPSNPPLEFGAAASGMVALQTDENLASKSRGVNLTVAGAGLNLSDQIGKNTSIVSYLNWNNGYLLKNLNKDAFSKLDGFNSLDVGIHLVHLFNPSTRLKVFNYSLNESYDYQFSHPSHEGIFAQKKKRNLTIINFQKNWRGIVLHVNQGINFSDGSFETGNVLNNIIRKDFFSSVNINYQIDKLSVKTGYALDAHFATVGGSFPVFYHALSNVHPSGNFEQDEKYIIPESFLILKYELNQKISIGGSRRISFNTSSVPKFRSYQGNLKFQFNRRNKLQLAGGIYRKFQLPNATTDLAQIITSKQLSLDYLHERNNIKVQAAVYAKRTSYESFKNPIMGAELFVEYKDGPIKTSLALAHVQSNIEKDAMLYPSQNNFDLFLRWIGKYEWEDVCDISAIFIHRNGNYYQPVIGSTFHEETETYIPQYSSLEDGKILDDYQSLDLSISKGFILGQGSLITFVSANNTFNRSNQESPKYNEDYNQNGFNYFNQRVFFAGMVYNW